MIKFPEDFFWGAATSAYQVEGGNVNSDWWPWEKATGKESSGDACCHYELYEQDFDLAKSLNHNSHRLSIEWSRVEPQEGKFSQKELKHYIDVILSLKARNIEPMVTLHHFTNPVWFSQSGGWEDKRSVERFLRYCDIVVRLLAPHVRYWITINEPTIFMSHAYLFGVWPPQVKSLKRMWQVYNNLAKAHIKAYSCIHQIYKEMQLPESHVGFSQYTQAFVPCRQNWKDRFAAYFRNELYNLGFIKRCLHNKALDFIGVNYYSRQLVEVKGWNFGDWAMEACKSNHHPVKKNSLGWDIYPEGLYGILVKLKKYRLPVIITENGICTADDTQRSEYIDLHLRQIYCAIEQGVLVKGYFYWSLLDNFEWDKGFGPRFGLVDVDYKTLKRMIRESAKKFADVCKTGVLN